MLVQLNIKGLAVINELSINFDNGFNVITGETGAGKSILIKALTLLFGGKASAETIREGCENANITACFELDSKHAVFKLLQQFEITYENDDTQMQTKTNSLIIRRNIYKNSRSSAWVNDTPVSIKVLKDLSIHLVEIFAQNEGTKLFDQSKHINFLDSFIPETKTNQQLLDSFKTGYNAVNNKFKQCLDYIKLYNEKKNSLDYLEYRFTELNDFDPCVQDYNNLKESCTSIRNQIKTNEMFTSLNEKLVFKGTTLGQLCWKFHYASLKLEGHNETMKKICTESADIAQKLDDISYNLAKANDSSSFNSFDVEKSQKRLAQYQELVRKLRVNNIEELVAEYQNIRDEIEFINNAKKNTLEFIIDMNSMIQDLIPLKDKITKLRQKAANKLKNNIEKELYDLSLPNARLLVELLEIHKAKPSELDKILVLIQSEEHKELFLNIVEFISTSKDHGNEDARFMFSANKGESPKALHKVASGGEVSRIMLAFKKALVLDAKTCLLVFDEIDTGISGKVADEVGKKISEIASSFQVICISHLAQVSAYADTHFLVEKKDINNHTQTNIRSLKMAEREKELARLLSGQKISVESIANAKKMISRASLN